MSLLTPFINKFNGIKKLADDITENIIASDDNPNNIDAIDTPLDFSVAPSVSYSDLNNTVTVDSIGDISTRQLELRLRGALVSLLPTNDILDTVDIANKMLDEFASSDTSESKVLNVIKKSIARLKKLPQYLHSKLTQQPWLSPISQHIGVIFLEKRKKTSSVIPSKWDDPKVQPLLLDIELKLNPNINTNIKSANATINTLAKSNLSIQARTTHNPNPSDPKAKDYYLTPDIYAFTLIDRLKTSLKDSYNTILGDKSCLIKWDNMVNIREGVNNNALPLSLNDNMTTVTQKGGKTPIIAIGIDKIPITPKGNSIS